MIRIYNDQYLYIKVYIYLSNFIHIRLIPLYTILRIYTTTQYIHKFRSHSSHQAIQFRWLYSSMATTVFEKHLSFIFIFVQRISIMQLAYVYTVHQCKRFIKSFKKFYDFFFFLFFFFLIFYFPNLKCIYLFGFTHIYHRRCI